MRRLAILAVAATALAGGAGWAASSAVDGYTAHVVLPSATGLVEGSKVLVDGFDSGQVGDIEVVNGKARVALDMDDEVAPLHSGAEAAIVWKAVLGERQVDIRDGAESNPAILDGGTLEGKMPDPVEIDKVLNALDRPTRTHLRSSIKRLNTIVGSNETELRQTLTQAGPAIAALGGVLREVGSDGRAIGQLVSETNEMISVLSRRDAVVRGIVERLSGMSRDLVREREAMRAGLAKLPDVVSRADRTLGKVPDVADQAVPLLEDLRPAAERLPSVASKLQPVLRDLRPMVTRLRPTLDAADMLLQRTPALLDSTKQVLPGSESAISDLTPALSFLRPYTPEIVGWLSNWASSAGNYDSKGRYMRIFVPGSGSSFNHNPGVMPPGMVHDPYPLPGELVGQPWQDAYGSGPR